MVNLDCGECPFLCNDEHSSGCGAPFPIDHCETFNKAMEEESKMRKENVEKWGKEHPIVTNADKFREVFGTSPIMVNADESFVCPERVGFDCNCEAIDSCTSCKINFWTSEYKAPKEEDK